MQIGLTREEVMTAIEYYLHNALSIPDNLTAQSIQVSQVRVEDNTMATITLAPAGTAKKEPEADEDTLTEDTPVAEPKPEPQAEVKEKPATKPKAKAKPKAKPKATRKDMPEPEPTTEVAKDAEKPLFDTDDDDDAPFDLDDAPAVEEPKAKVEEPDESPELDFS